MTEVPAQTREHFSKGLGNPTTSSTLAMVMTRMYAGEKKQTTILPPFLNFFDGNVQARQGHPEERTNWKSSGKAACASRDLNKLPARTFGESKLVRPWRVNLVTYAENLEHCTQKGMQVKLFDVVSPLCGIGLQMDRTFQTALDP